MRQNKTAKNVAGVTYHCCTCVYKCVNGLTEHSLDIVRRSMKHSYTEHPKQERIKLRLLNLLNAAGETDNAELPSYTFFKFKNKLNENSEAQIA